jgi:hypothetical protein
MPINSHKHQTQKNPMTKQNLKSKDFLNHRLQLNLSQKQKAFLNFKKSS